MKEEQKKLTMKEKIRARAKEREGHGQGGHDLFTLPEDLELLEIRKKMRLDVLPYRVTAENHPNAKAGEKWYQRTIFIHRNIGADQKRVICPKTIGKKCPICEEWQKMKRDENADEEMTKSLRPSERELFNVIDLDNVKKGVQLLHISFACFGEKLEEEVREGEEDLAGFPYLKGGKTLIVRFREEQIGKSKYWDLSKVEFEDRDVYEDTILDEVIDLDTILKILSYEQLDTLFHTGQESSDEEESDKGKETEEEAEEDSRPSRRHAPKKEAEEEDSEDDADEDAADDDGDGARRKKARRPEKDESDSDSDDEDDDGDSDKHGKKPSDDPDESDSDDDDDDTPPKKKSKKPADDDGDDDEGVDRKRVSNEEEEDDDGEAEPEKPSRRRK